MDVEMPNMKYILKGKKVIPEPNLLKWATFFHFEDRHIGRDIVGHVLISTVFLGLDHRFNVESGKPIVFETMIFGGKHDQWQRRYCTWEEAEKGHEKAVKLVKDKQNDE
jgi:hypothetical protein